MAWERRKTGSYYYEKKRVNGKTVSIYWGNGELAREREQQIRLRRVSKRAKRVTDTENKELLNEVSSRGKQALRLLLDNVAQLYRLKGRRVPKLCQQRSVARAASPSVSRPAWPCLLEQTVTSMPRSRAQNQPNPKTRNLSPNSTPTANLQHNQDRDATAKRRRGFRAKRRPALHPARTRTSEPSSS